MRCASSRSVRRGAAILESAIVYPAVFLFTIGLIVGAMGVFRYHQVAHLARETARFASTHAGQYATENSKAIADGTLPNVDGAYLINKIKADSIDLDPSQITVIVRINTTDGTYGWDDTKGTTNRSTTSTKTAGSTTTSYTNTVSVTITYRWIPEALFGGSYDLSSTSVMPLFY